MTERRAPRLGTIAERSAMRTERNRSSSASESLEARDPSRVVVSSFPYYSSPSSAVSVPVPVFFSASASASASPSGSRSSGTSIGSLSLTLLLNASVASSHTRAASLALPGFLSRIAPGSISSQSAVAFFHQCVSMPNPRFRTVTRTTRRPPNSRGS